MTDRPPRLELRVPRSVSQLLALGLRLFARFPLMLVLLAGTIVIPYSIVSDVLTSGRHVSQSTEFVLVLVGFAVVTPIIVALQMQALTDLSAQRRPRAADVIARGLKVLPVVAATEIVATLITLVGVVFIIPAVLAQVRFAVAAPVAATEGLSWPEAIRRSIALTRRNGWRVLGLILIEDALTFLVAAATGSASPALAVVRVIAALIVQSFCTLLLSLLYFDLRARESGPVVSG